MVLAQDCCRIFEWDIFDTVMMTQNEGKAVQACDVDADECIVPFISCNPL